MLHLKTEESATSTIHQTALKNWVASERFKFDFSPDDRKISSGIRSRRRVPGCGRPESESSLSGHGTSTSFFVQAKWAEENLLPPGKKSCLRVTSRRRGRYSTPPLCENPCAIFSRSRSNETSQAVSGYLTAFSNAQMTRWRSRSVRWRRSGSCIDRRSTIDETGIRAIRDDQRAGFPPLCVDRPFMQRTQT